MKRLCMITLYPWLKWPLLALCKVFGHSPNAACDRDGNTICVRCGADCKVF